MWLSLVLFLSIFLRPATLAIIYKDLHLIKTQTNIRDDNRRKAGIYCMYNSINGKFYIGSAITNRINARLRELRSLIASTRSVLLRRAINKYGIINFWFII